MINWKELQQMEIINIIKSFKPSDSHDIYGMSTNLLNKIFYEIAGPLTVVIISLQRCPIMVANVRPISIIPVFTEVIETAMKDQILECFESNKQFTEVQHGILKSRSTTATVIDLVTRIKHKFEEKESVALTVCDLSKAFDCTPLTVFGSKLSKYGIGGTVLTALKSNLENRRKIE